MLSLERLFESRRPGGAAAPELPTDDLIARWHQGAGIVTGLDTAPDPDEVTVDTWTDVVSSVVLGNTAAANEPRLPGVTPTFEGDGATVVHYLKTAGSTGLGAHKSHTVVIAGSPNDAAGIRFLFECNAVAATWRVCMDSGLLGFTAPGSGNISSAVTPDGSFRVLVLTLDATAGVATLYDGTDSIASDSSYAGSSEVSSGIAIGSSNTGVIARGLNGTVNEALIYEGVLDAAARVQVVAFLDQEYG